MDNIVVKVFIKGMVSFEAVKKDIDINKYFFKDRSECIDVIYSFDKYDKKIKSIEFDRHDINARLVFLESDINEEVPKELVVENISTSEEIRNVYPERKKVTLNLRRKNEDCFGIHILVDDSVVLFP